MPLHDWTDDGWWENFHTFWTTHLAEAIRRTLPDGYRVYIGTYSQVGLAALTDHGDDGPVSMTPANASESATDGEIEPDGEVAVATVEPRRAVYVQHRGLMVAAVEIVSRGVRTGRRAGPGRRLGTPATSTTGST